MRSYCLNTNSSTVRAVRRDHGPRPDRRDGSVNKRHSANAALIERLTAGHPQSGARRENRRSWRVMKPTPESSAQEVVAGLVERVTFHNAENGFCVLRAKAGGHRDLVTVVGHAAIISAGEWITASGEWINDRAHGQQFKARFLKQRNLLYTGVTRGKRLVVLVGQKKAIAIAVRNVSGPGVSAVRGSLIVANCLTRSAAL